METVLAMYGCMDWELGMVMECCGESYWGLYLELLNYYEIN